MNKDELNKLSKSQLIDLMLSKNEIPQNLSSSSPSPSIISNVVKWGKKQVENWGNWLMKGAKLGVTKSSDLIKNLGEWFMNVDEAPKKDEEEDEEAYETAPEDEEEDEEAYFTAEEGDDAVDIRLLDQALQGYTKSYEISIKNNKDPLLQLQKTRELLLNLILKIF